MNHFEEYQRELVARRVRRHRETLREAGLRPLQLWVADTRQAGFAAACKDQCQAVDERRSRRRLRRRWIQLRRGDLVTLEPGRTTATRVPRHALVIQHELFAAHACVAVLSVTNGRGTASLLRVSVGDARFAAVDQPRMIPRRSVRGIYGRVDAMALREIDRALALFLGIVR